MANEKCKMRNGKSVLLSYSRPDNSNCERSTSALSKRRAENFLDDEKWKILTEKRKIYLDFLLALRRQKLRQKLRINIPSREDHTHTPGIVRYFVNEHRRSGGSA
jgi:hypothetical protein